MKLKKVKQRPKVIDAGNNQLKDIWQIHTDVQEQMLQLRSVPVSIISDSAKILGEKLYLTADENNKTDKFIEEITSTFNLSADEINLENGYFLADMETAREISLEDKKSLFERSAANFINFQPLPIIDGYIKISNPTSVQSLSLLSQRLPNILYNNEVYRNQESDTIIVSTKDGVLRDTILTTNNLSLIGYKFIFYIDTEAPLIYRNKDLGQFNEEKKSFSFNTNLKGRNKIEDIEVGRSNETLNYDKSWDWDYNFKFTLYKRKIESIFGNENVRFEIYFDYSYDLCQEIENLLREKFPSIQTKKNDKNGTLYFCQEYQTTEQGYRLRQMIEIELNSLNSNTFEFSLYPIPENKEKYILEIDAQSKQEAQASAVKELRGYDFTVGKSEFGKLFRVNYPQMIFDISGDDFEKTKQLFESHIVDSITPNLTGDLEKIYRLKNSLNNILSGNNLQNANLKDFIFDADRARKIEDIDYHTNLQSETFRELDNHLLNTKINLPQKQAIIKTLLAEDLALIQGPPGTGKSTAIAEIIWQHIRKDAKERILLTSETNLAVDNAIDKVVNENHNLVKPIRIGGEEKLEMEGRQFSIEVMKRWVEKDGTTEISEEEQNEDEENLPQKIILQNWIDNIRRRVYKIGLDNTLTSLWINMLSNPSKQMRQIFLENYIKNCNVIGATCSSIGQTNSQGKWTNFYWGFQEVFGRGKNVEFTTVIQDESSKATPAELSLPLVYGKKNIIIGDHRQLPPMLDKEEFKLSLNFLLDKTEKKEDIKELKELKSFVLKHFDEMEISHFERLFEKIDDSLKGLFNLQYRMHPDINDVIKQFYIRDGGLDCGLITPTDLGVNDPNMKNPASRYHGIEIERFISKDNHVIWIDTDSPEILDGTSRINYGEIEAIREVLAKFQSSDSFAQYQSFWKNPEDQQIGLISFYGKQIKLLQNLRNEFRDIPIRVSTVDRFQGMERNIIIVSMVRSNSIAVDKKQKSDTNLYGKLGFPEQKDLGFAQSPNRLNVALSRAKRLLIIVGNSELFKQKDIYNNVYNTIANNPNGRIIKYETK